MSTLLVVDWDFFFVRCFEANNEELAKMEKRGDSRWNYDWGHRESPMFIDTMWPIRASSFRRQGLELPGLTGEQVNFWDRFMVSPRADLYVGESNSYAIDDQVFYAYDDVWLYDAHHDCGYNTDQSVDDLLDSGSIECGSWMAAYWNIGSQLHVRYPTWCEWEKRESEMQVPVDDVDRDYALPNLDPDDDIDAVFICRSGAWMPPWVDDDFVRFVKDCPTRNKPKVISPQPYNPMVPREFSIEVVDKYVEMMDATMRDKKRA